MPQVPYTPHANAYELSNLFQTVKPKRVHPLIPRCYADNRMSVIAADLLNDDCEIVENDNFPENHESEDENSVRAFFDTSREISGELSSDEMYNDAPVLDLLSDDDQNRYIFFLKLKHFVEEFPTDFRFCLLICCWFWFFSTANNHQMTKRIKNKQIALN